MDRFVPREKLSKKLRRRRDAEKRALWSVPPVTKRVESKKRYTRKGRVRDRLDGGADLFLPPMPSRAFYGTQFTAFRR